jgi:UDP:flavonoid glycosyltransferase YjiC (YdhE family)
MSDRERSELTDATTREADAVRAAIVRVLEDASFRGAAGRVRSSIASMPSPDDVAEGLEALR